MGGKGTFGKGTGHRPVRARRLRTATVSVVAAALTFGVAPVIGDVLNDRPLPATVQTPPTVAASVAQSRAAPVYGNGASTSAKNETPSRKKSVLKSRVTEVPVVTEEGKGTFVGVKCPKGFKAISGGVISSYINLLISSSSPNHPLSGKYTPQTWWLTVTNANVDGQGGSLSWRGVVNCLAPVAIRK